MRERGCTGDQPCVASIWKQAAFCSRPSGEHLIRRGRSPLERPDHSAHLAVGRGLVYGKENLTGIGNFSYPTEGWGITSDNKSLIMSDGTDILHILDPESFAETGQIKSSQRLAA